MENVKDKPEALASISLMAEKFHGTSPVQIGKIQNLTGILTRGMARLYPGSISAQLATRIVLYSPLHDAGKILIPEIILKKAGPLTDAEYETMKTHTIKGVEYLKKVKIFKDEADLAVACQIAESHHEKYDGTGYPHGLKGEEIPLPARIVALADVYDALRSPRRYKSAYTHAEAVGIILNGDNKTKPGHFDPRILEVFKANLAEIEKIYGA